MVRALLDSGEAVRAFVDDCIARLMKGELDVPTAAMATPRITTPR